MPAKVNSSRSRLDCALLLLRAAALLLFFTAGLEKVEELISALHAGKPLATTGLALLITKLGLPFPVFCALYVVINESLGALLISIGLFTRVTAFCAALSMMGAFYTSVHFGWEPFRAFLYIVIFAALAAAGAGRFSLDTPFIKFQLVKSSVDTALLILRVGLLVFFVLLFTMKKVGAAQSFVHGSAILPYVAAALAIAVILGCWTRPVAFLSCALWGWGALAGLIAKQPWDIFPYRDILIFVLFAVLAVAGPGAFSLENSKRQH